MATSLTEIANHAGVSVALVSRFYNQDKSLRISDEKRKAILDATKKLGGVPASRAARSLQRGLTHNISVPINEKIAVHGVGSVFGRDAGDRVMGGLCLAALAEALREKDFRLSMNLFNPGDGECATMESLDPEGYCDGLVLVEGVTDKPLAEALLANHIPHVCTDPQTEVLGINTVTAHRLSGLRQAIAHLYELGHRRIGFLGSRKLRLPLFVAALLERDLPFDDSFNCITPNYSSLRLDYKVWLDGAAKLLSQWLSRATPVTALVCQNDHLALKAIEVIRQHGMEPGRDISVVGYDNIEERSVGFASKPILTSIDNPVDMVGKRCAEMLLRQILDKQQNILHEYVPMKLIVRRTTGPCRT